MQRSGKQKINNKTQASYSENTEATAAAAAAPLIYKLICNNVHTHR